MSKIIYRIQKCLQIIDAIVILVFLFKEPTIHNLH